MTEYNTLHRDIELLPLRVYTQGKILSTESFLSLACALADSLARLHASGIVHRGVQPDRIFISTAPLRAIFAVTDDVSEAISSPSENPHLMVTSGVVDDIAYMAPEQMGGRERSVDYRTDIYSLGAVLYELACLRPPHEESELTAWIHAHLAKEVISPLHWNERIPSVVANILTKCLAKVPANRYQSAYALYVDLHRCYDDWHKARHIEDFSLGTHDFIDVDVIFERFWARAQQMEQLNTISLRAQQGEAPIALIEGEEGSGKSSLIQTFANVAAADPIHVSVARFNGNPWTPQYGVLAALFRAILRKLIAYPVTELKQWQNKFQTELSEVSDFLLDILPELEHLMPSVKVTQSGNRPTHSEVTEGFAQLIKVISKAGKPLVLCLDDVHLIDDDSAQVLRLLLLYYKLPYVGWVLALDKNSRKQNSRWSSLWDDALGHRNVSVIGLTGFDEVTITEILAAIYPSPRHHFKPLAAEVFRYTHGNPLLLHRLLTRLQQLGYVRFDPEAGGWHWDERLPKTAVQIVNDYPTYRQPLLITSRTAQNLLSWIAVIGRHFDTALLSAVSEIPEEQVLRELQLLETVGWIRQEKELSHQNSQGVLVGNRFMFVQESIRQDLLEELSQDRRAEMHWNIGFRLVRHIADPKLSPAAVYDIVNHLNAGSSCVDDKRLLAEVNLLAGQQALLNAKFAFAVEYFTAGAEWLQQVPMAKNYEGLQFELAYGLVNGRYMAGDATVSEDDYRHVLRCSHNSVQAMLIVVRYLDYCFAMGQGKVALANIQRLLSEHSNVKLGNRYTSIANRMQLYGLSQFQYGRNEGIVKGRSKSRAGINDQVSQSELLFQAITLASQGQFNEALTLAQKRLPPLEQSIDSSLSAEVYFTMGAFIEPWRKEQRAAVEHLQLAAGRAVLAQDVFLAAAANLCSVGLQFTLGVPLSNLLKNLDDGIARIRSIKNRFLESLYESLRESLEHVSNGSDLDIRLDGPLADLTGSAPLFWNWLQLFRLTGAYLVADTTKALSISADMLSSSSVTPTSFAGYAELLVIRSILLADRYEQSVPMEGPRLWREFKSLLRRMQEHEAQRNDCEHLVLLMQAEQARMKGNYYAAMDLYELSAAKSLEFGKKQYSGIVNERAATYALRRNHLNYARALFSAAIDDYDAWGAVHRARKIQQQHFAVLRRGKGERRRRSANAGIAVQGSITSEMSQRMDWAMISRAAQTLSREVVLERLLERLMTLLLESAGAQRGFILLARDEKLYVEAFASVDEPLREVEQSVPLENSANQLSSYIVDYTFRTKEDLVLDDASASVRFADDPYIIHHQPKSVLCTAMLSRQKVVGVLYLENNRMTQAFTDNRLQLIKVLAAQAGISFENAYLYRSLEQQVQDRTRALEESSEALSQANKQLAKANDELRKSEEMRRQLLANVSHDLRTPITLIAGYAEALVSGVAETEEQVRNFAGQIQNKTQVLTHLIEDLFNLVRLEARQTELKTEMCTAEELLVDMTMRFESDVQQAGLNFVWSGVDADDITADGTWIQVDRDRIYQVFANIIYNAMKHTPKNGTICIELLVDVKTVTFSVSDTGSGIAAKDLPYVFDRFYKADKSRTEQSGSGLGLAIAKQIVDLHEGSIAVESQKGEGTTFGVTLPRADV